MGVITECERNHFRTPSDRVPDFLIRPSALPKTIMHKHGTCLTGAERFFDLGLPLQRRTDVVVGNEYIYPVIAKFGLNTTHETSFLVDVTRKDLDVMFTPFHGSTSIPCSGALPSA